MAAADKHIIVYYNTSRAAKAAKGGGHCHVLQTNVTKLFTR